MEAKKGKCSLIEYNSEYFVGAVIDVFDTSLTIPNSANHYDLHTMVFYYFLN